MSQIPGTQYDIVKTLDGMTTDSQFNDKFPLSTGGQRKTVVLGKRMMLAALRIDTGISMALSKNAGQSWKVNNDVFADVANPEMSNALNPALAIDRKSNVHLAFRAFNNQVAPPFPKIWYARSTNGSIWTPPVAFPSVGGVVQVHGYPLIGTGPKKQIYIAFDVSGNLFLHRSLDAGQSWQPVQQLTQVANDDTRPSMAVDRDGIVYIAYSVYGFLYCMKSEDQGETWQSRKIFGSERVGGHYPSIALDRNRKPVIAYRAFSSPVGPDVYRGIQVHRQVDNWSNTWSEHILDSAYTLDINFQTPSLTIAFDNTPKVAYLRTTQQNNLPAEYWPRDIVFTESPDWVNWSKPAMLTQSASFLYAPQFWPNLYWQPSKPPKSGFLLLWDGKKEDTVTTGGIWLARSFVSQDFSV